MLCGCVKVVEIVVLIFISTESLARGLFFKSALTCSYVNALEITTAKRRRVAIRLIFNPLCSGWTCYCSDQ